MTELKNWEVVLRVAIGFNCISILATLVTLFNIVIYREYRVMKERLILMVAVCTLLYAVFNMTEHFYNLSEGEHYQVPWIIVAGAYGFWWGLLCVEVYLLIFLLVVVRESLTAVTLKPVFFSYGTELLGYIVMVIVIIIVGTLSAITIGTSCETYSDLKASGNDDDEIKDPSNECTDALKLFSIVYVGCLSIPLLLQAALMWYQCSRGSSTIRERVLENVVRPLRWYPIMFLLSAFGYVLWMIAIYAADTAGEWKHQAGIGSALTFSLKGAINSIIYFCSRAPREFGFFEQAKQFCSARSDLDDLDRIDVGLVEYEDEDEDDELYGGNGLNAVPASPQRRFAGGAASSPRRTLNA